MDTCDVGGETESRRPSTFRSLGDAAGASEPERGEGEETTNTSGGDTLGGDVPVYTSQGFETTDSRHKALVTQTTSYIMIIRP